MTGAYAGILNGGSSVTPYGLIELRLVGDETALMGASGGIGERVIQEQAAKQLTYMMLRAVQDGTGQRAQMQGWDVAGKTGTTQAARDAWFIGFTADFVTGVWMGYDDNTPLTGTTGGGLPADIWRETMLRVHANNSPKPLPLIIPKELPYQNPRPIDTKDDANSGRNEPSAIENFRVNSLAADQTDFVIPDKRVYIAFMSIELCLYISSFGKQHIDALDKNIEKQRLPRTVRHKENKIIAPLATHNRISLHFIKFAHLTRRLYFDLSAYEFAKPRAIFF